jgi:hypothetical protein
MLDSDSTFLSLQFEFRHFVVRHFGFRQKVAAPLSKNNYLLMYRMKEVREGTWKTNYSNNVKIMK